MSEVGLGLWGMGGWSDADDRQSRAALQLAAELGCTFFDSAWDYGSGKSDRLLGELVSRATVAPDPRASADDARPPVFAATKVRPFNGKWPADPHDRYDEVFPSDYVIDSVHRSREALQVDTIDLLQLHVWDDTWVDAPAFAATAGYLKDSGLIRHFGLSLNDWEPANGIKAIRTGLVDTVQVVYNIFEQAPEDELFAACREYDVGVIARVPLDEGSLAGGLTLQTSFPADDCRSRYFKPANLAATVGRVEKLRALLPAGMSMAEMALRFILAHETVSTVIAGMRGEAHVRANLQPGERTLPRALLAQLREHRWDRRPAAWSA